MVIKHQLKKHPKVNLKSILRKTKRKHQFSDIFVKNTQKKTPILKSLSKNTQRRNTNFWKRSRKHLENTQKNTFHITIDPIPSVARTRP